MTPLHWNFRLSPDQAAYLKASARIRGISVASLMMRLVEVICADQMVLSILDDDSKREKRPHEHRYSEKERP
jgi:hypothetical protein